MRGASTCLGLHLLQSISGNASAAERPLYLHRAKCWVYHNITQLQIYRGTSSAPESAPALLIWCPSQYLSESAPVSGSTFLSHNACHFMQQESILHVTHNPCYNNIHTVYFVRCHHHQGRPHRSDGIVTVNDTVVTAENVAGGASTSYGSTTIPQGPHSKTNCLPTITNQDELAHSMGSSSSSRRSSDPLSSEPGTPTHPPTFQNLHHFQVGHSSTLVTPHA